MCIMSDKTSGNLLDDPWVASAGESFENLLVRDGIRLERICSRGHVSPDGFWFDQVQDEWVAVLSGAAELHFEDEDAPRRLTAGDYLLIRAHRRHRVIWTSPDTDTVWLALHIDPRA
jgi:cupin 2 domain-containing protein